MSTWFAATAPLPAIRAQVALSPFHEALLTSSVQGGFVAGTLDSAVPPGQRLAGLAQPWRAARQPGLLRPHVGAVCDVAMDRRPASSSSRWSSVGWGGGSPLRCWQQARSSASLPWPGCAAPDFRYAGPAHSGPWSQKTNWKDAHALQAHPRRPDRAEFRHHGNRGLCNPARPERCGARAVHLAFQADADDEAGTGSGRPRPLRAGVA